MLFLLGWWSPGVHLRSGCILELGLHLTNQYQNYSDLSQSPSPGASKLCKAPVSHPGSQQHLRCPMTSEPAFTQLAKKGCKLEVITTVKAAVWF